MSGPARAYGLRPRPAVDPVVAVLVAEAVLEVWPRAAGDAADEAGRARMERAALAWRFSGRWWTRPSVVRSARPWAR